MAPSSASSSRLRREKNFHQDADDDDDVPLYKIWIPDPDSQDLWGFLGERPRCGDGCITVARADHWQSAAGLHQRGPDDLGRSSGRPHQGAAALQILRVNFYDKCLCKVMHIDFHFLDFSFFPFGTSFFFGSGSKGRMCQTVMYLVWESPEIFLFFFHRLPLLLLNDQHFIGEFIFPSRNPS